MTGAADENSARGSGPLAGLRVIEMCGIGPGPHCAMLLSDLGAEVLRVDRAGGNGWPNPIVDRGRHVLELDIRSDRGREMILETVDHADILIEGFRPGVMERLGLGPDELCSRNPRLIFGRMTGWGQSGPLARAAGHDINYIALTGALAAITDETGRPIPPLNLVGDFGGGSLFLTLGILAAVIERNRSGKGQVVDAAIVDGVASLMTMFSGLLPQDRISLDPSQNTLGGRAPFYRCYECADGGYVAIGPLEEPFYVALLEAIGATDLHDEDRGAADRWSSLSRRLEAVFRTRTRDDWCALLEGTDVCFAPVLSYAESLEHSHMVARDTYVSHAGLVQAGPAPRFSRTPGLIQSGGNGAELRRQWISG